MAVSIDERVVEMRFNNKQFEEGVKQSMKSLDNLDHSIDNLDNKNLNNLVEKLNKINFDAIEQSVGTLEKRFSAMGIAGMTVIQKLVDGVTNLGSKLLSTVTKPLKIMKEGGWARAMNIENAKFQIEGLGLAFDELESSISNAVDGTAYGFDAAAKAAGQLAASGVKAGEEMDGALRAISGVAAMANTSYEAISPIFTTIAGQGKVMTMQLRQLETRGINAAATLAKALGTTEANVRDMVTKGKIDFQTFATAMNDAFGEHATKANETYEGSLANMQARLKQIGQIVATEWIQGMVGVHNAVRNLLTVVKEELVPILQNEVNPVIHDVLAVVTAVINKIGQSEKFREYIHNIGVEIAVLAQNLQHIFYQTLVRLDPIINDLYIIGKAIKVIFKNITGSNKDFNFTIVLVTALDYALNAILAVLQGIVTVIKLITLTIANSGIGDIIKAYIIPAAKVILPLIAAYLIITRLHLLKIVAVLGAVTAAIAAVSRFHIVQKIIDLSKSLYTLVHVRLVQLRARGVDILGFLNKLKKFDIKGIIHDIQNGINNLSTSIKTGLANAGKGFIEGVTAPGKAIKNLIENLQNADGIIGGIRDRVLNIISTIKARSSVVLGFFKGFAKGIAEIKPEFLFVGTMGLIIMTTFSGLTKAIKNVTAALNTMSEAFKSLATIPTTITSSIKEIADSYLLMAKADMRRSTIALIIAFAGALVVLATAIAIISKVVYPEDFVKIAGMVAALGLIIGGIVTGILYLHSKMNPLQKAAEETLSTGTAVVNAIKEFGKNISKALAIKAIGSVFKSLAVFIIALTGSLIMLHQYIPDTRYLTDIVTSLTEFVSVIGVVITVIAAVSRNSVSSAGAVLGFALTFASIAGAMLLMINALEQFRELKMDSKELVNVLYAIGATALLMIGASALMARAFQGVTTSILSLIASIAALVIIIKAAPDFVRAFGDALSEIAESFKNLSEYQQKSFVEIIGLISGLIIAGMAVSRMATHGIRVILTVTAVVGALVAMLKVLEGLGNNQEALNRISKAFDELQNVLLGISICLGILFWSAGKAQYGVRAALLLLTIPVAMLALIGEMKLVMNLVKGMDTESLNMILEIFVALSLSISMILLCSSQAGKAWGAIMGLTTVIISLTFMLGALALMYDAAPESVAVGSIIVIGALLSMSLVLHQLGRMTKNKLATGTILVILFGLAACIAAVGAVVTSIIYFGDSYKWAEIAAVFGGLIGVMLSLAAVSTAMFNLSKAIKKNKISVANITMAGGLMLSALFSLVVAATSISIVLRNSTPEDFANIAAAAGGMSVMLIAVSKTLEVMSKLNTSRVNKAIKAAMALSLASASFAVIGFALSMLKDIPWQEVLGYAAAMSLVFVALSVALGALSRIAPDGETIIMVSVALTMLSVSLIAMAGALRILAESADPNVITTAAWAIGGLTIALSAALAVLALVPGVAELILPVAAAIIVTLISAAAAAVGVAVAIDLLLFGLEKFLGFLVTNKDTIEDALTNFGKGILKLVKKLGKSLVKIVESIIETLVTGVVKLLEGFFKIIQTFNTGVLTTAKQFMVDLSTLIIEGSSELGVSVYTGMVTIASYLKQGFTEVKKIMGEDTSILGKFFSQGISFGMLDNIGLVMNAAYAVAQAGVAASALGFDEHSASKIGKKQGYFFNLGIALGMNEDEPVQKAANMTAKQTVKTFAEKLLGKETVEAGENMIKTTIDGAQDFLNSSGGDKLKAIGDYIGNLIGGSANSKISELMSSLGLDSSLYQISAEDQAKAQAQAVANIHNKIKMNDLYRKGLEQEANLMKNIGNDYNVSIEQTATYLKDVDNEYQRLIKDIKKKGPLESILDQIKQTAEEAGEALDPTSLFGDDPFGDMGNSAGKATNKLEMLKASIDSVTEGFSEFNREVSITKKDIIKDLNSQVMGLTEYMQALEVLAGRGFSKDVIEALNDLGVEQGYQYAAALLKATEKEVPKINKMFKDKAKLSKVSQKDIEKWYTKSGEAVSKAYIKGAKNKKAWKDFSIGKDGATYTGKALRKELSKVLNGIDMSKLIEKDKKGTLTRALNAYLDSTTSKSEEATDAFQEYLTKAYLATLSETEMQEALNKSEKALAKDVMTYWNEQSKSVKQSVQDQIRSMEDLSKAGTMTGEELIKKLKKQYKDYAEYTADKRQMLLAASLAGASDETLDYIKNSATTDEILAFTQLAIDKGAEQAGKEYVKFFEKGVNTGADDETAFDAVLYGKSKAKKREALADLDEYTTEFESAEKKYLKAVKGIKKGSNGLVSTDKKISKVAENISKAFTFLSTTNGTTAFESATKALEGYALSLLDYDAILEEVSITGADISDVIQTQLKNMTTALKDWRNDLESSLKSALQSFEKFDEGEEKA